MSQWRLAVFVLGFSIACQSEPQAQKAQSSTPSAPPARAQATPRLQELAKPISKIETLKHFQASAFCREYKCGPPESYSLKDGGTNNTFPLSLDHTTMEVETAGDRVTGVGLSLYERDRLRDSDLRAVGLLFRSLDATVPTRAIEQFVRDNAEKDVEQIKRARSIRFGDYRVWAGKIGNQVISAERGTGGTPARTR